MSKLFESLQLQINCLKMEYEYEKNAYLETMKKAPLTGRVADGDCWFPVRLGNSFYNATNQLVIEVEYDGEMPEEQVSDFEPGKAVNFFRIDSNGITTPINHTCFVNFVKDNRMQLAIGNMQVLSAIMNQSRQFVLGVRMGVDDYSYQVMHEALSRVMDATDEHFVSLRSVLLGERQPEFRRLLLPQIPWLNESQNMAVNKVLNARETAIVHGPPGTGKTTTLVEAIYETLKRETQVLVCAPSNAAVDWISEQLYRRGISVLRIGNPLRINNVMMDCSYEYRYANHPDYLELFGIRRSIRDLNAMPKKGEKEQNQLRKLRCREAELEAKIREDLFNTSSVVACTLIGCANRLMERRHFGTLFIDEAAQALEAACWTAILKADRVIFAGDHQQLPPTIRCVEAAKAGLDHTLMQKVVKSKPSCVSLLNVQYRMNRLIMDFSSRQFYHGRLMADPSVADSLVSPIDKPLMWVDTSNCDFGERMNKSQSRLNQEEAKLLMTTLMDYVKLIGMERMLRDGVDFGIISPYKAQVRLIRKYLRHNKMLKPLRNAMSVNTVDGFQGQERDVILVSLVRDNANGNIGFLGDLRRMNVAITRARKKLIVVGNADTLGHHKFYDKLIAYFQENGDFVCPQVTLDRETPPQTSL